MKAEEIYAVLERIRSFVQSHTLPDGSFPANSPNIGISLEFCETLIHEAYEKENGKTGIVID